MPQCQFPVFCYFCVSEKLQEIFSELDETKPEPLIFPGRETKTEREPEGGQGPTTPGGGMGGPPPYGVEPLVHL
jgi:hypothetical protein